MNFDKAYDLLDGVRERLENTIPNSSVDLMPSDTDDFFITVTQRNKTTGNESKWSFCVDFRTNKVQMLEPVEDEESFKNGNEIFSIIKNFLNGGMSREKRFGNKIGSSNKTVVRQGPNLKTLDETPAEHIMKNLDAYKGYTRYDMEQLVLNPSGYTLYDGNNRKAVYKKDGAEDIILLFRNGELKDAKITSSLKPIKSSLSDVNKALGFTDKDIEEDGKIHITTDFGEFVVDYVNDEYIVTYDGEERIFTEYKDTVEEVVDLFNQLCNEEIKLFNENINSSKPIKSNYSNKEVVVKILDSSDYEARNVLESYGGQLDYDIWSISKENIQDVKDEINDWKNRIVFYSSYNYRSGRFGKKLTESAVKYTNCKSIKSSKSVCIGFNTENGTLLWKRDNLYTLDGSSIRQTKRKDIADKWIEKYNLNTTDTERLDKYTQEGIGQIPWGLPLVEDKEGRNYNKELASILPKHGIKSDFNPYYEKHPDTLVAYLVGDKDSITQEDIDKAEKEYKLFYEGYGTLYGDKGHLFIGPYSSIKSYFEDYVGVGLVDDYLYTYGTDHSILDNFVREQNKPLPTEKDYQDFVNQLNNYVVENYGVDKYGPLYKFEMYKENGMNNDGWGNEYPNIVIYDDEGNLDMHSDSDITEYIRKELEVKGWYPEAVHSSSDFTIAII